MIGEPLTTLADKLADGVQRQSNALLYNIGIAQPLPWLPEYVALRDEYYSIPRLLRWLFWRKRQELKGLRRQQQALFILAIIDEAERRAVRKRLGID